MKAMARATFFACIGILATHSMAQSFPARPVTIVVPAAPGGSLDIVARLMAQKMKEPLGQTVLVDNRGGASGEVGAGQVARGAPDGYTILVAIPNPLGKYLGAGLATEMQPIGIVGDAGQLVLAVQASSPAHDVNALADLMRSDKSKANYVSSGGGFPSHITAELFKREGKFDAQHIPVRGGGQAMQELLSGRMSFTFPAAILAQSQAKAGKIRLLAVPHARRSPLVPEVPTMAEAGLAGVTVPTFWIGAFAPKNTPKEIVNRLAAALQSINTEDFRAVLERQGFAPSSLSPDEVAARVRRDANFWTGTATALKIEASE
jgi:tripartite-type tricarboxylate transporter receptor subunit TctC